MLVLTPFSPCGMLPKLFKSPAHFLRAVRQQVGGPLPYMGFQSHSLRGVEDGFSPPRCSCIIVP